MFTHHCTACDQTQLIFFSQVTGTNNPETRARRIEKSIAALREGRIR